jgi:site-specific DNA-methyltransferase (adenine-specific)
MILHADCLDAMAGMEPESVDAICTDPPYGLGFMGKDWDTAGRLASVPPSVARRIADGSDVGRLGNYPGGKGQTAFDGPQMQRWHGAWAEAAYRVAKPSAYLLAFGGTRTVHRMTVALEDAGWIIRDMLVWAYASGFPKSKASLKPAWEPIVMARKPGPLRDLAIDACRIELAAGDRVDYGVTKTPAGGKHEGWARPWMQDQDDFNRRNAEAVERANALGRWPANVILTDDLFEPGVPGVVGGGEDYSRFFALPKADRAEREPVPGMLPRQAVDAKMGLVHGGPGEIGKGSKEGYEYHPAPRRNVHPTVKPLDLMRHLVRLVTPTGGTVLDPFLGSGTTGIAAEMEGFSWIGIEKEAEYVAIAEARLHGVQRGIGL